MKLKKLVTLAMAGIISASFLTGCGGSTESANNGDEKYTIAMVTDVAGVNDQSFNQSAWEGLQRAEKELGVEVKYLESKQDADYTTNVETLVDEEVDLILGVGAKLAPTIEEAAKNYPEQKFLMVDETYEEIPSNVKSVLFDAEQSGVKYYMANFSKKVKDEISGSFVADPFVIDYPTEVVISGLDQAGVNIGFGGIDIADEFVSDNENENHAYCTYYDEAAGAMDGLTYKGNVTLALCVYGMMDICSVATELQSNDNNFYECNGIKVSDDGQSFVNCEFGQSLAGVRVYTALDWTDGETGEEMYWSDDMYDYEWIQNLVVSSLKNSQGNTVGMHDVGAICDALPSGVTKRYAVIHLNGRGVTSEPIFVLQGNITLAEAKADYIATGITNVKNNEAKKSTKKFNLAGQQVDNNFKGIVISNGKKTIKRN